MDYDYRENMQNQEPNQVQDAPSAEKKKKRKGMTGQDCGTGTGLRDGWRCDRRRGDVRCAAFFRDI